MKHSRLVPLMRYITNKVVWKLSLDEELHTGPFMADDSGSAHWRHLQYLHTANLLILPLSLSLVVLCILGSNEEVLEWPLRASTARGVLLLSEGSILWLGAVKAWDKTMLQKEKQFISYRQFCKMFPVCISVIASKCKASIAKFLLLLMSFHVLTL